MNYRDKRLVVTVRVIFGLMLLLSGVMGLMQGNSTAGVPESMVPVVQALWKSGLFQMIKVTEAVVGVMFIVGFLPALAAIFIAPVCVGIIVFNSQMAPSMWLPGVILSALDAYLGYAYWDKYQCLFKRS